MKTLSPPARVWSPGAPLLGAARGAAGHAGLSRADRAAPAPPVAGLRGRRDAVAATATAGQPRRIGTEHKAGTLRPCARRRVRRSIPGLRAEAAAQMPAETLPAARRPPACPLARAPPTARSARRSLRPPRPAAPPGARVGEARARALDSCSGAPERRPHHAVAPPLSRSARPSASTPCSPPLIPEPQAARGSEGTARSALVQSCLDRGPTAMDELLVLLSATGYSGGTPEKRDFGARGCVG